MKMKGVLEVNVMALIRLLLVALFFIIVITLAIIYLPGFWEGMMGAGDTLTKNSPLG